MTPKIKRFTRKPLFDTTKILTRKQHAELRAYITACETVGRSVIKMPLTYYSRQYYYTGQIKNGKPHGNGTLISVLDKFTLRGVWLEGVLCVNNVIIDSEHAVYYGRVAFNLHPNGSGTCIWKKPTFIRQISACWTNGVIDSSIPFSVVNKLGLIQMYIGSDGACCRSVTYNEGIQVFEIAENDKEHVSQLQLIGDRQIMATSIVEKGKVHTVSKQGHNATLQVEGSSKVYLFNATFDNRADIIEEKNNDVISQQFREAATRDVDAVDFAPQSTTFESGVFANYRREAWFIDTPQVHKGPLSFPGMYVMARPPAVNVLRTH